jgi:hypothetical protein
MSADKATLEARLRYKAAYTAYMSCVRALSEVVARGERPSQALLDNEAKSLRELTEARGAFLKKLFEHSRKGG